MARDCHVRQENGYERTQFDHNTVYDCIIADNYGLSAAFKARPYIIRGTFFLLIYF